MPSVSSQKYRSILACAVVFAAGLGAVVAFTRSGDVTVREPVADATGLFAYEAEGFRYEYHAPTGLEGLYDLRNDPDGLTSVVRGHEDVAARCRSALAKRENVDRVEALRARYDDTVRRLHALGYL